MSAACSVIGRAVVLAAPAVLPKVNSTGPSGNTSSGSAGAVVMAVSAGLATDAKGPGASTPDAGRLVVSAVYGATAPASGHCGTGRGTGAVGPSGS